VAEAKPTLWHISVSHYSEKARWALDYKGVEAERRSAMPGAHMLVALWLTRGKENTFPVMRLDAENVGDSTAIIGALESRYPDPPLYPEDPAERQRALALEDFFDEELGPHIRLLAWHELVKDREAFEQLVRKMIPPALHATAGPASRLFLRLRWNVQDEAAADLARTKVIAALDRLEVELDGGDHLVGGRFTVADLTAAALFYPLALPPEAPQLMAGAPAGLERFREPLRERPGYRWIADTFRRHRRRAPEPVAA
jgi:glutathione S-transferase